MRRLTGILMIVDVITSGICGLMHHYDAATYYAVLGILLLIVFCVFEYPDAGNEDDDDDDNTAT